MGASRTPPHSTGAPSEKINWAFHMFTPPVETSHPACRGVIPARVAIDFHHGRKRGKRIAERQHVQSAKCIRAHVTNLKIVTWSAS